MTGLSFINTTRAVPPVRVNTEHFTMPSPTFHAVGNVLVGHPVLPYKFQGITTLAQIEAFGLIRPTLIDRNLKSHNQQQSAAHELHDVTNRKFDKARLDNAQDYSGYIEAVECHDREGGTPAITIYHREHLDDTDNGVVVPYGAALVAIDGETQTEARYILAERSPETKNNPIAITVYHGISVEAAMQILHDYNTKGLNWSEVKAARFNHTGQLSKAAQEIIDRAGVPQSKVNYRGDGATKKHYFSLQQVLTAVAGYQLNGQGMVTTVGKSHFKRFNEQGAVSVPPTCIDHMTSIVAQAEHNSAIGAAKPLVWQVAGVLLSQNYQPNQLDWARAVSVYRDTASGGRGGPRMPAKDRIARLANAMLGKR
ncbi:MAG: hypothetical protein ACK2UO_12330 [Caldilineaceae bacterium]